MTDRTPDPYMLTGDDDELDGCALDFTDDPTPDSDVPYVALAGGRTGVAARKRIEEVAAAIRAFREAPDA